MNIFAIAWKSIRQRGLASSLTALSVSLGVALMVAILIVNALVTSTFKQTGSGYDLIVGPQGSKTDLVLSTIYRIGAPIENLPWRYYEELKKDPRIENAVPFAFGDSTEVGNFPIIGTTVEYFTIEYIPGKKFLVKGDWPVKTWDAVIGAKVAKDNNWTIGSQFKLIHAGQDDHVHDEMFTVTGILAKTGTANDRTVFVNLGGFFALAGHEKPAEEALAREADFFGEPLETIKERYKAELADLASHDHSAEGHEHHHHATPDFQKEVTSILLKMSHPENRPTIAQSKAIEFSSELKEGFKAQAVNPVEVMNKLNRELVGNVSLAMLFLTYLIIIISGIGIFVSIYNSMSDRRREIAIMRALGADRIHILLIILSESILLCLVGGMVGMLLGHGLVVVAAPLIEARAGLLIEPFAFELAELYILPGMLVLAIIVGFIPAMTAYQTNVAEHLQS